MSAPGVSGPRAEDIPLRRRLAAFAVLMLFEFFYGWCWNTVDVLRPQIRQALHLTLTQAGSIYTAQGLGALAGAIVLGQAADAVGRRRMVAVVVVGYALCAAAGALASAYPLLLLQRALLGFFLGGNFPVIIAAYLGLFQPEWRGKLASVSNGAYNLAIVALGASLSLRWAQADWRMVLLVGALPPLALAPLLLVVPGDRTIPWGSDGVRAPLRRLPILELFSAGLARRTLLLFLVVGLNFFGYQAFAGWVTTYLKDARGFSVGVAGAIVAWQFAGATLGSFFWGWFSDRFGRRRAGVGFFGAGLAAALYLGLPRDPAALKAAGFAWGFLIACSVAWGPWMSELFPARLRSTAMSIFNWGRLISIGAPLITGAMADRLGLRAAMSLSVLAFGLAGVVWLALPETLDRSTGARRPRSGGGLVIKPEA